MQLEMKNVSVRLDSDVRRKLKIIADKEFRPVANQMALFIREGIARYEAEHDITI